MAKRKRKDGQEESSLVSLNQQSKMAKRKRKDGQEESSPISSNQQSKSKRKKKAKDGKPNANYKKRLEVNFKRKILMERGINTKELEDTFVMEEIGRLEWHTFVTMRNQCNELMVRQFYAAMIPSVFERGGPVFVRGKNVYISPKDINDWLGTKSYPELEDGYQNKKDYKMYNLNLAKVIQDNPSPRWLKGKKLTQRQLGFRQHFWNIFFSYSLIPARHRNSVSLEMAIILYCMSKKLKFDVGTLIHRRMVEIGKKNCTVLAFPCLITHFMEKAKLRVDDPADGIMSPRMCGRKAYNEAAGPRGVLKLPTCADQIAEKRRLEKEAAAAERGEDSEEVESEDLQDSDNSEDKDQQIRKLVKTVNTVIAQLKGLMRSNHDHTGRGNRASPSVTASEEVDSLEKRRPEKEATAAVSVDDSEEVQSEKEDAEIEDTEQEREDKEDAELRSKKRHDSRAVADALETTQTQAEQPKPVTPTHELEHVQTDPPTSTDETHRQTDHTAAIDNDEAQPEKSLVSYNLRSQVNPPDPDGTHMTDSQAAQTHAQQAEKILVSYNLRSQVNPPKKLGYGNQPPLHRDCKPETKKLIILDLNGVLAHIQYKKNVSNSLLSKYKVNGNQAVLERPNLREFLECCFQNFKVAVWSSKELKNVKSVLDVLMDKDTQDKLLFTWSREKCTVTNANTSETSKKPLVFKNLDNCWNDKLLNGKYNEFNTLLVDDSPYKALLNPAHTGVFPTTFNGQELDDELVTLQAYLLNLAKAENIQAFVSKHPFGQQLNEKSEDWHYYQRVISEHGLRVGRGTTRNSQEEGFRN